MPAARLPGPSLLIMTSAISASGAVKDYGATRALDGLDLDVARGGLDPVRRATLLERFDLDPTKKARSTPRGTGRRSLSSPGSPRMPRCCCSTSRRRDSTR